MRYEGAITALTTEYRVY